MAVPKSKRSKRITSIYRNNSIKKTLNKYNIKINSRILHFQNFNNNEVLSGEKKCSYCCDTSYKNVCLNCYTKHFKGAYIKYINRKN